MEILGILRSVAVRFVKMESPPSMFITDLVEALRARYRFLEVPDRAAEVDPAKGFRFALGRMGDETIQRLEIFDTGLLVAANLESAVLDQFLDDLLQWAVGELGVTYVDTKPVTRAYVSSLEVKPSGDLSRWLGYFERATRALTEMVEEQGFTIAPYTVNGIAFQTDGDKAGPEPLRPARFVFERRVDQPIEENVFFSEGPISTESHRRLLEILDQSL